MCQSTTFFTSKKFHNYVSGFQLGLLTVEFAFDQTVLLLLTVCDIKMYTLAKLPIQSLELGSQCEWKLTSHKISMVKKFSVFSVIGNPHGPDL